MAPTCTNISGNIARIETSFIEIPGELVVIFIFLGAFSIVTDCQNKLLQNPSYGKLMTINDVVKSINDNDLA